MASSIANISLSITSETGLQDALQGVITQSFTLTDYDDGSDTPVLTSGRTGEIGGALYRVIDGDFTVDVSAVSGNGTYYIYVEDDGLTVEAYADDTVIQYRHGTKQKAVFIIVMRKRFLGLHGTGLIIMIEQIFYKQRDTYLKI